MAAINRRLVLGAGFASLVVSCRKGGTGRPYGATITDWAWTDRYRSDNAQLIRSKSPIETVFLGDSITEMWSEIRPRSFAPGWINRGISGQTVPQMAARMMDDVIALKPRTLHLLGGTNDIAGNGGPASDDQITATLEAIVLLAQSTNITVLLGSIPPATRFFWSPATDPRPRIVALNARLKDMCARHNVTWIDYHTALADSAGGLAASYGEDGVHPNDHGYAIMEAVLTHALSQ